MAIFTETRGDSESGVTAADLLSTIADEGEVVSFESKSPCVLEPRKSTHNNEVVELLEYRWQQKCVRGINVAPDASIRLDKEGRCRSEQESGPHREG